jgi:hypothetical protein
VYFKAGMPEALQAIGEHLEKRTDVHIANLRQFGGYNQQLIVTLALFKLADDVTESA